MRNKITNIVVFIFSFIFLVGIFYVFYIDLNFFITKKFASAAILKVDTSDSKVFFKLRYYNNYLNSEVQPTLSLERQAAGQILKDKTVGGQVLISYAKNYPYKIYIDNINAPRFLIIIFEILMILIMSFSVYISIKNFKKSNLST